MLYRVHEGPDAREARGAARVSQGLRAAARRRRHAAREGLREAARAHQGPPGRAAAADGHAALAAAGGVQPRQRRPLRARLRVVHAFHLADPALSRSAGAPRDQGGAAAASATSRATGPRWACIARRPSGAPTRRRATSISWLKCYYMRDRVGETFDGHASAASPRSACSSRSTTSTSRGWCTCPSSASDYFHFDRGEAPADGRAHAPALPARRPRAGEAGARRPRHDQDRFRAARQWGRPHGRRRARRAAGREEGPLCPRALTRMFTAMTETRIIYGFHAVTSRLRQSPRQREGGLSRRCARRPRVRASC